MPKAGAASPPTRSRCRSRSAPTDGQAGFSRSGGTSQRSSPVPGARGRRASIRARAPFFMEALSKSQIVASSELKSGSWPTITTREGLPASLSSRSTSSTPTPPPSDRSAWTSMPRRSPTRSAVCMARSLGDEMIASGWKPIPSRNEPSRSLCFSPLDDSGRSASRPRQDSGLPASAWRSRYSSTVSRTWPVSGIEVFNLAAGEEDHVLGDVGDPVADPLEIVGGEQDPRTALNVVGVLPHQVDQLGERPVIERIDLVVAGGHGTGLVLVDVD